MKAYTKLKYLLLTAASTLLMAGCDLMHDNREDCPEGLYIHLIYDYNLHLMDMFNGHVGEVETFIFDKDGKFVLSRIEMNDGQNRPLAQNGYSMQVIDIEPGEYQIVALCQQRSREETKNRPGAKYSYSRLEPGDDISKLTIALDRGDWDESYYPESNEKVSGFIIDNQSAPLDTLWHGFQHDIVTVERNKPAYTTVSLLRNTNGLHISLRQIEEEEAKMDIADYDIYITDRNSVLSYENEILGDDQVKYTPHITWNTQDMTRATGEPSRTAHAELDFNRLTHRTNDDMPAMLHIFNNKTNAVVAKVNLSDVLQQGRGGFDYFNYSAQEYLDREYNYSLSFFLVGDKWKYIEVSISTLPWKKRIQNSDI